MFVKMKSRKKNKNRQGTLEEPRDISECALLINALGMDHSRSWEACANCPLYEQCVYVLSLGEIVETTSG